VDEIEANSRILSQRVLEAVNMQSESLRQVEAGEAQNTERFRLGIYFYRETSGPERGTPKDGDNEQE